MALYQFCIWLVIMALPMSGMAFCMMSKKYKVLEETENQFIFQIPPKMSWFMGLFSGTIASLPILFSFLAINEPLQNTLINAGFCAFFSLITFLILAVAPYITCSLDQTLNLVVIERRSLFGKKVLEDKITNIVAVEIETQSSDGELTSRVTLTLASGKKLPLTYFFESKGWQEDEFIAHRIRKFL